MKISERVSMSFRIALGTFIGRAIINLIKHQSWFVDALFTFIITFLIGLLAYWITDKVRKKKEESK